MTLSLFSFTCLGKIFNSVLAAFTFKTLRDVKTKWIRYL